MVPGLKKILSVVLAAKLVGISISFASEYYISPSGSNLNSGTIGSPWGTFDHAISQINAGDTLFVRGGTYTLNSRIRIQKGGSESNPINLWAYPGETPILDFNSNPSSTDRGIQLERDWWHFKGLVIQNAPDNGIWVSGSNNRFDQLVLRWNGDSGFQLSGDSSRHPSNNWILNTDSYENYDPQNHGENADGFAAKFRELGPGNVFSGNRAWGNSDDGWDFWEAAYGITVENSWSFNNGFNRWGDSSFAGDGNGIKLGKDSGTHAVHHMLVWGNRDNGVDVNGNASPDSSIPHGVEVYNVTSYNNGNKNFRFDEDYPHVLRNNVSLAGSNTIYGLVDDLFNTWNGIPVDELDFLSLDASGATGPRQADGSLPVLDFLRLASGSNLIDAGIDVGLPFAGSAPDLGACEVDPIVYDIADFNQDGSIDQADLIQWANDFGVNSNSDADHDGDSDGADFLLWQTHYPGLAAITSPVPEPASFLILIVLLGPVMPRPHSLNGGGSA